MKKFLAMLVVAAMLASLGALVAHAEVDESEWEPFGEVTSQYMEDMSDVITLDGDVSDWQAYPDVFKRYDIDKYNLDAWVGEVDENWSINMWFGADAEFLYIAFKINDSDVTYSDDNSYSGDAFQIQLDFNGWAAATEGYNRAVFYSFGLQEDNTVDITVQCIDGDDASTIDYYMASDDEAEWADGTVKGATKAAEDGSGWYAEFAISWQTLYRDICTKLSEEELPEWKGGEDEIFLNMLVCYLDHTSDTTGVQGAWGTSAALGSLAAADGWYPENAGMVLKLKGMGSVTVEEITTEEEEDTTKADDKEDDTTKADDKEDDATTAPEGSEEATTEAPVEKNDCKGIVGAGVLAIIALGACVVAKKKD